MQGLGLLDYLTCDLTMSVGPALLVQFGAVGVSLLGIGPVISHPVSQLASIRCRMPVATYSTGTALALLNS